MTTSSGTVNQLDTVRIGINGRVLKYRSVASLMNVRVGDLVEYEADESGVWLENIRRVDGESSEPVPKQDAKAILQDNLKAKQEEEKSPLAAAPAIDTKKDGVLNVDQSSAPSKEIETQVIRHIHENKEDRPDSVEIGTPSKGGVIKVYYNANDPQKALELVDNAFVVRAYANSKYLDQQGAKE